MIIRWEVGELGQDIRIWVKILNIYPPSLISFYEKITKFIGFTFSNLSQPIGFICFQMWIQGSIYDTESGVLAQVGEIVRSGGDLNPIQNFHTSETSTWKIWKQSSFGWFADDVLMFF